MKKEINICEKIISCHKRLTSHDSDQCPMQTTEIGRLYFEHRNHTGNCKSKHFLSSPKQKLLVF